MSKVKKRTFVGCEIKSLPASKAAEAVRVAVEQNPANAAPLAALSALALVGPMDPPRLNVYTTKYWGAGGVDLTVQFLDVEDRTTRNLILAHMNSWGGFSEVKFREVARDGQVRISTTRDGYWSYLGTDVLLVGKSYPTMNLQSFNAKTPDAEYRRVVRHETGHTLGCPHGHLLPSVVKRIDPEKAYKWFEAQYGWNKSMVDGNVLTPLVPADLTGSTEEDLDSIMTYSLPGSIMKDGKPVPGGADFTRKDMIDAGRLYPLRTPPPVFGRGLQVFAAGGKVSWKNAKGEVKTVEPYPGHRGVIHVATNGVHVATAPGRGGGPHVRFFHAETGEPTGEVLAIDPASRLGAHVCMSPGWGQCRVTLGEGAGPVYQEFDPAGGRPVAGVASFGNAAATRTGMTCAFAGNPNV